MDSISQYIVCFFKNFGAFDTFCCCTKDLYFVHNFDSLHDLVYFMCSGFSGTFILRNNKIIKRTKLQPTASKSIRKSLARLASISYDLKETNENQGASQDSGNADHFP